MAVSSAGTSAASSEAPRTASPAPITFPNFLEMRSYLPAWAWRLLRSVSVLCALGLAALAWQRPAIGLPVFWGLAVPVLPLVFMLTPGLWRNLCPLATSNQLPRRLGIAQGLAQKTLSQGKAYPIGITMMIAAVIARRLVFNVSGTATALLIVSAMGAAFVGGLIFKGKSGWCSSICPLLPVQRLYGQTPLIKIANTQCDTCVGCAKNCYDFNPGLAYLADQYDPNPHYRNFRRLFACVFPGLILGYYLVPGAEVIGPTAVVWQMLLYMAASLSLFTLLDLAIGATRNVLPVLSAAMAINLYYWFAAPAVAQALTLLGVYPDLTFVGGLRMAVAIASVVWVFRSMKTERAFLHEQVQRSGKGEIVLAPVMIETLQTHRHAEPVPVPAPLPVATPVAAPAPAAFAPACAPVPAVVMPATLCIEPTGQTTPVVPDSTLLDLLEGCGAEIHPGCRAGACGADPIAVMHGGDCLNAIGDTERATLARLGHAPNTRLACMARVRKAGAMTIALKPLDASADDMLVSQPAQLVTQPGALDEVPAMGKERALLPSLRTPVAMLAPQPRTASANDTHAPPGAASRHAADIRQVIVVGNGVAGLTAAEHLRRQHPHCQIDLIAREPQPAYNRMAVTSLITQPQGMHSLQLKPERWYTEQRITPWLNTRAMGLDTVAQTLSLATGETLAYDRLILATGAQAWVPPIEGYGALGCYVLRQATDAMSLRAYVQRYGVRRATVVGAGLLGIEAADALRTLKLMVSVLSLDDRVLGRQVDATASRLLSQHLAHQGIDVVTHAEVRAVVRDARGLPSQLQLADGRSLDSELLVVCAGTRPDLKLAREGGLAIGRGIRVDGWMRTSARNVFAAGDVAEFEGQLHGLWGVAGEQGRLAAFNALGASERYRPSVPVTALKLRGIRIRSAGQAELGGDAQREVWLAPRLAGKAAAHSRPQHTKLVLGAANQVLGAVIVGDDPDGDDILQAVSARSDLSALRSLLVRRAGKGRLQALPEPQDRAA